MQYLFFSSFYLMYNNYFELFCGPFFPFGTHTHEKMQIRISLNTTPVSLLISHFIYYQKAWIYFPLEKKGSYTLIVVYLSFLIASSVSSFPFFS